MFLSLKISHFFVVRPFKTIYSSYFEIHSALLLTVFTLLCSRMSYGHMLLCLSVLTSFNIMSSTATYVVINNIHIFFVHSSLDGIRWLLILATVNSVAVATGVQISLRQTYFSSF